MTMSALKEKLPERISQLANLANNLYNLWDKEARDLWRRVDTPLWNQTRHNPIEMLKLISKKKLEELAEDASFLVKYDAVIFKFNKIMQRKNLWFPQTYPEYAKNHIAYISTEFALHQSMPIYSGGLGVLSGDHCKEASDLGLPFVAVGLMYSQGYFVQRITPDGNQVAKFENMEFQDTALHVVKKKNVESESSTDEQEPFILEVPLDSHIVKCRVWHVKVGRTNLYLLDTDIDLNENPNDRKLSLRLYETDRDLRFRQELLLGLGSVLLLRRLDYDPKVWHINEGHSAFTLLELIREEVAAGATFEKAKKKIQSRTLFTTHTPVPAGHETFDISLVEKYLKSMVKNDLGIPFEDFIELGKYNDEFNMTMFALSCCEIVNGVSKLNAKVMNKRLGGLLDKSFPDQEAPIIAITNGVHVPSWVPSALFDLFSKYMSRSWLENHDEEIVWERIYDIPDRELWATRKELKQKLFNFIMERDRRRWREGKITAAQTLSSGALLDPDALTIGFARRFAPYKRSTLIFKDIERLKRIVNDPYRPVQFIFAGKSHPANEEGKAMIREIYQKTLDPEFSGRIIFLEDYGLNVARYLVQGVDIWLNTPRRPMEASGTSGMKAAMNGAPNLSVLDGWWDEGYNGRNGWVVGSHNPERHKFVTKQSQDEYDVETLYNVLEKEIIPLYYKRDPEGIPRNWLEIIRESVKAAIWEFSTRRMIKEYAARAYIPLQKQPQVEDEVC